MEELSLPDIIAICKRRRTYFAVTTAVLAILSFAFAVHWSNYRSTATVQIEQPEISQTVTESAAGGENTVAEALADQRISTVDQTVTSLDSLAAIITRFNLYPAQRKTTPMVERVTRMRDKIRLNFIGSTISNPAEAQKASAAQLSAIAFTLSFDYPNPQLAQQVTNELVNRFLDEDLKLRHRQAEETSVFLDAQIASLENEMADQGKKMAEFRARNGESGPAALAYNQQALSTASLALQTLESELTANEGTEGQLRAQLATVDPYSRVIADGRVLTTPAVQLKALQAQYATLSSQYGPSHPDLIRIGHQIAALKAEQAGNGGGENTAALQAEIKDVQTNLATAQATGGPDNPDVIGLTHRLKSLQGQLASARKSGGENGAAGIRRDADNPAYIQIASQLQAAEEQHKSLAAQQGKLQAQLEKYQRAIAENPGTQQQMDVLSRDYDNEQLRYRELKEKKMLADMSEQLESGRNGQRLTVIIPPDLPVKTYPARLLILLAGLFLSVLGGFAAVAIREATNLSIHGSHQIAHIVGTAPLVMIPYITTPAEIERQRRLRPYMIGGIAGLVIVALAVFPYVLMPYDVLWSIISHKFGLS
jgi:uncharacterized protein involved in exopolysaccharide biosynthesis